MLWWAKQKVMLRLLLTKMHLFIIVRGCCYSLLSTDVKAAELNGYIMQLRETPNQQLSFNFHYKPSKSQNASQNEQQIRTLPDCTNPKYICSLIFNVYLLCFFQILVNSVTQPALLYENVVVSEGKPILRDMLFSPDHQYIYTLTEKEVRLQGVCCLWWSTCFIWLECSEEPNGQAVWFGHAHESPKRPNRKENTQNENEETRFPNAWLI